MRKNRRIVAYRKFVASTIVGATREDQIDDMFAAAGLTLTDEVLKAIGAVTKEPLYPMD